MKDGRSPIRWISYRSAADLLSPDGVGRARLIFWSPGLEDRAAVAAHLCAQWPTAQLYTLTDAAGLSTVFAARRDGSAWEPSIARGRWTVTGCPPVLATEGSAAAAALATARQLEASGQPAAALTALQAAARASVLQFELFDQLARSLLARDVGVAAAEEALFWAQRAVTASGYCRPAVVNTLLQVYVRLGQPAAAQRVKDAERTARTSVCANLAADHPFRRPPGH